MRVALDIFLLAAGFALLVKGADIFVGASVDIAKRLKIPSIVIGLTVVAFGTSAPEAAISISAAAGGSNGLAVGNVIGSNIFNLMLIIGLCALISPIYIKLKEIIRDYWVSVGAAAALVLMMLIFREAVPRFGGLVLFVGFVIYMIALVRKALKDREDNTGENDEAENAPRKSLARIIVRAVVGLALIIGGGQSTVYGAVNIALILGLTERVVGLTILAMGTSLPELVTTVAACRKKENDIAVGNIIGSNIFNLMLVLGVSGMIMPLAVDVSLIFDISVLIAGSLLFLLFAYSKKRVARFEGIAMVLIYAAYTGVLIFT